MSPKLQVFNRKRKRGIVPVAESSEIGDAVEAGVGAADVVVALVGGAGTAGEEILEVIPASAAEDAVVEAEGPRGEGDIVVAERDVGIDFNEVEDMVEKDVGSDHIGTVGGSGAVVSEEAFVPSVGVAEGLAEITDDARGAEEIRMGVVDEGLEPEVESCVAGHLDDGVATATVTEGVEGVDLGVVEADRRDEELLPLFPVFASVGDSSTASMPAEDDIDQALHEYGFDLEAIPDMSSDDFWGTGGTSGQDFETNFDRVVGDDIEAAGEQPGPSRSSGHGGAAVDLSEPGEDFGLGASQSFADAGLFARMPALISVRILTL